MAKTEYICWMIGYDKNPVDGEIVVVGKIVRCRNCKYFLDNSDVNSYNVCTKIYGTFFANEDEDGYCAWGEKK